MNREANRRKDAKKNTETQAQRHTEETDYKKKNQK